MNKEQQTEYLKLLKHIVEITGMLSDMNKIITIQADLIQKLEYRIDCLEDEVGKL